MSASLRRSIALVFAAFCTAALGAPETTLRWRNGETLAGEIVEASAEELTWKSPLFEEPLVLAWPALRRIDSPQPSVAATDPFSIALRDGSHLFGDIASLTDDAVVIKSERHGVVSLNRSAVLSLRRTRSDKIAFAGPTGEVGWTVKSTAPNGRDTTRTSAVPMMKSGPGGSLLLPYWNVGAGMEIPLPESLLIEFQFRSSKRLDFQLALLGDEKQRLRIETWGDRLVLAAGDAFAMLRDVPEDTRELTLRLAWNRKTGACTVFSPEGEKLVEWQAPEDATRKKEPHSLLLHNKGRDLTVEALKIRSWDGLPPAKIVSTLPRVEVADGRVLTGALGSVGDGAIPVAGTDGAPGETVPVAQITELILSGDRPEPAATSPGISYADGTFLHGRVLGIKDGSASVAVTFSGEPLTSRMGALRHLAMEAGDPKANPKEHSLEGLDKIVIGSVTLHGKLAASGDHLPRWLPAGGVQAAKLSSAARAEIHRYFPPDADLPAAPALFYLRYGDVLPGTLRSLDATGVDIHSTVTDLRKLPAEDLDAIYFGAASRMNIKSFNDPGWRITKGNEKTVERKEDGSVTLEPDTAIAHPSVMQSSEMKFKLQASGGYGAVRLRLFCAGTEPAKSLNLVIMRMGNRITCGIESGENQIEQQSQSLVDQKASVPVRIVLNEESIVLHVNDAELLTHPIPAKQRAGNGLVIDPSSLWGNPVQKISLSDFSAVTDPGGTWVPDVSPESRLQALTIPRFRKERPPRQVLIAANGDLLRGEIQAVTSTHIGFLSGLETLRIPRDRVKAAVWLKKPADGEANKPAQSAKPKWFDRLIPNRVNYSGATLSTLVNFLRRQVPELKFRLPEEGSSESRPMSFGRQTVGAALDEVASIFDLRYRIDEAGTVIFERGREVAPSLAERVYWMKPGAFPEKESPQEILTAKGVLFPKEASVQWQPRERQLAIVNTPENLAKVDEVLKAEFGPGGAIALSHWFQLANGGRLALEVERFEEDFVHGVHPVYGPCRLPVPEIFAIRTSNPGATPAMLALTDWYLTDAPEPVLPETGGESSPTLGQEAKAIKLPLLSGGDFDLSKEKGKVVVLDFWASWCGPCVKSLPGLIAAMAEFPPEQVKFVGVNQGEPAAVVKRFLETRDWNLTVALDMNQATGRAYSVEGIPHTVIIGQDGKIAWVKTGYTPTADKEVSDAVKRLLVPLQADASPGRK